MTHEELLSYRRSLPISKDNIQHYLSCISSFFVGQFGLSRSGSGFKIQRTDREIQLNPDHIRKTSASGEPSGLLYFIYIHVDPQTSDNVPLIVRSTGQEPLTGL